MKIITAKSINKSMKNLTSNHCVSTLKSIMMNRMVIKESKETWEEGRE